MRRNLDTLRTRFGDAVLPGEHRRAGGGPARRDRRRPPAAGRRRRTARTRWSRSGSSSGARLVERDPPDVEGATRFASALFLGALGRLTA